MKYEEVPFIMTGKDLDYLSDAFSWEILGYKKAILVSDSISDSNFSKQALNVAKMHDNHMNKLISILKEAESESSK